MANLLIQTFSDLIKKDQVLFNSLVRSTDYDSFSRIAIDACKKRGINISEDVFSEYAKKMHQGNYLFLSDEQLCSHLGWNPSASSDEANTGTSSSSC